jgi:hypothetical protein
MRLLLIVSLCCCVAACADAMPSPAFTVDTIGGVPTVRNGKPVALLDTVPLASIGSAGFETAGAPDEFGEVNSVVADADGNVYIADGRNREVRVFGPTGAHLRTFGRGGGGPGEFGALYSLAWMGDTLLALDPGNARIALLSKTGEALGTWRWMALTGSVQIVRFFPTGPRDVYVRFFRRDSSRPDADQFVRLTPGGPADTVAVDRPTDLPRYSVLCRGEAFISSFSVPFAPGFLATPAPGRRFASALTGAYRFAFVDVRGDTTHVVEGSEPPLPVSEVSWDSLSGEFRTWRAQFQGATCEPDAPVRPPAQPVIRGIFFDAEGTVVVEAATPSGLVYDFFDGDGIVRARAPAPERDPRVPPFFRDGRVYVVQRDSLDVPTVRSFRLAPPASSAR